MKNINSKDICWDCKGSGKVMGPGMMLRNCRQCDGVGKRKEGGDNLVIKSKNPSSSLHLTAPIRIHDPVIEPKRRGRPRKT